MVKKIAKKTFGKKKKVFYPSTPKKQQKRNPEKELIGIYKQGQGNFGFIDTVDKVTGEKQGYFTHESKKLDALEGDEVAFEVRNFKGRPEAEIKKVLKRSEQLVVGKLKIGKSYAFVISENSKVKKDIFIPGKYIGGHSDGSVVAVQVLKWEGKNPEGRIVESLKSLPKGREDIYKIAFEMGARKSFSPKIQEQLNTFSAKIKDSELKYRKDKRDLLTFTIDGAESKDLDDAISLQVNKDGWTLFVHIADVAHYVGENTALDREARKRGTSIYLVDQVIPMLPKEISNGLCSLHPGEDKLTLTCEMQISSAGQVTKSEVYNSVIHSDYRLTYKEVDQMSFTQDLGVSDELLFGSTISKELLATILDLKKLSDILPQNTKKRGALDFDFPETKIVLDDAGTPIDYKKYERYQSYKIIEECMVLANESVSRQYAKLPFLYRVHEDPDETDVEKFLKMLEALSVEKKDYGALSFSDILELLKSDTHLLHLQRLLLRSLSKACYSEKNLGHFGLALKYYSHFTSPIRRYPDLQIHRIIKEDLRGKLSAERKEYYKEILPKVARRSSDTSERAEKMEYRVRDMLACKYMSDKIGQEFSGTISGMIEKGFFVELSNTIEGFIEFGFTGYSYNVENFTIQHMSTGEEKRFGDEVKVRVRAIDMERYRIDFDLI